VVTIATYLMFALAIVAVVLAVLPLPWAGDASDAAKVAFKNIKNGDQVATTVTAAIYIGVAEFVLGAVALVVLGIFVGRGARVARIITWVLGGLGVLCCGGGIAIRGVASGMTSNSQGTTADAQQIQDAQKQVDAVYPSWYHGVQVSLSLLAIVGLLAVIVLLALPVANEYFRPNPMAIPAGMGTFPTDPAYPSADPAYPTVDSGPSPAPEIPDTPPSPERPTGTE
jgi:hypothetical protein